MKIYELEQNIMDTWNIVDDLRLVVERLNNPNLNHVQVKELTTLLESILTLYDYKFNRCFDTFCEVVKGKHSC